MFFSRILFMSFVVVSSSAVAMSLWQDEEDTYTPDNVTQIGKLQNSHLDEVSGMAPSRKHEGVIWVHNDSGDAPMLYAIRPDGTSIHAVRVENVKNVDWEDLASFTYQGKHYLLIGDVGDNNSWRDDTQLIIVEEPELDAESVTPVLVLPYGYDRGPRDTESLAYDADNHRVYLMSKRVVPAELFVLDLPSEFVSNDVSKPVVGKHVADLIALPQPTDADKKRRFGEYSSQPTAMDLKEDRMVVLTYKDAYLYEKKASQTWQETLNLPPQTIPLKRLKQQESIMWQPDSNGLIYMSEGEGAPILEVDLESP